MRSLLTVLLLVLSAAITVEGDNQYPIVLVHGFAGWGRDELLGLRYWGGLQGDIQEQLKAQGYTVFTAAVGPLSSNWDRACELYAQIKGGQVDYGADHAKAHSHARLGRNFTGLFPEWGTAKSDGSLHKVHLIGHSMGGQTIRMLTQLLAKGSNGAPVVEKASPHPLFAGGKDWVHSITTIATPNQGTLLADGFSEIGDLVKNLLIGVFSVLGVGGDVTQSIYDVKLDQWGITGKKPTESLAKYIQRVFDSPVLKPGFKDICLWSLSTAGAKEESKWVETLPNVYYYSYANVDTYGWRDFFLRKIQLPNLFTMLLPMQPLGGFLGSRYGPNKGFGTEWQANDGVVNTVSMAKDSVGKARSSSAVGQWNLMPQLNRMDHLAVIGLTLHTQVKNFYMAHSRLLAGLPAASAKQSLRNLEDEATTATATTTATVETVFGLMNAVSALNQAAGSTKSKEDLQARCAGVTDRYAVSYCQTMLAQHSAPRRSLRG